MDNINSVKEKYEELFNEKVAVAEMNGVTIVVPHCPGIDDK